MGDTKKRNILLVILVVGLVTMIIVYAVLIQRLDIKSKGRIKNKEESWNIHFKDVECSAKNSAIIQNDLVLEPNTTSVSGLQAAFKAPGDSVTCTFYVENTGSINAKISDYLKQDPTKTITYTGSGATKTQDEEKVQNKILYSLVYDSNNQEPRVNDLLNSGQSKKLKLTLTFDPDATDLPSNDVYISNFSSYIIYAQN